MDSSFDRRGLAVVRVNMRRDRTPLTGPAAWFVRFAGVYGIVCPLGFGGYTIPSIVSVAQGHGIIYVWGNPPYGDGPLEHTGVPTTLLLLLAGFLAACLVQLAGGVLLIWLRPAGFVVLPVGMLLSAIFWWGFDLPLAWRNAATVLPLLVAAWMVYRRASRDPSGLGRSSA